VRPVTVIEPRSYATLHPLRSLLRLHRFSDLLWTLTLHRLKVRYKHTRLGFAWAVLQPLALMSVFALMFSLLGRSPGGSVPYALFAYAALVPWTAFASGLTNASLSLTSHASLLTKVYFPREILPVSYVAAAIVDLAIASLGLVGLMAWYRVAPGPAILWTIPAVVLLALFLTGASLLLSALHVRHRDVGTAMPVLIQVWMFVTPVLYPLSMAKAGLSPVVYAVYLLNPMAGVTDTFRGAVLGRSPDPAALAAGFSVAAAVLVASFVYFKWCEMTVADAV
jgi:lipopolysaccharide transport system permease protein